MTFVPHFWFLVGEIWVLRGENEPRRFHQTFGTLQIVARRSMRFITTNLFYDCSKKLDRFINKMSLKQTSFFCDKSSQQSMVKITPGLVVLGQREEQQHGEVLRKYDQRISSFTQKHFWNYLNQGFPIWGTRTPRGTWDISGGTAV